MRAHRVLFSTLALVTAGSATWSAQAQPTLTETARAIPASAVAMKQSFAPVVKRAAPAVVNISAKRVVRQVDPFWERFGVGVPRNRVEGSLGSGVIVRSDGVIVTNNHVIAGGAGVEITVALSDRREFPAKVMLADERTDLAILKIDLPAGEKLPVMPIGDRSDIQVGDLVLAIGDPFGVGQTVTNGIISALNRTADPSGGAYIQTDAAINPGNSGGALVSMDGDLLGVNSFIYSQSGQSSGIGFAIPAVVVRRVVETAMSGGHAVVRPWLGARLQSVTPEIAKSIGLATPSGALISDVWPNGAAARAGLKQGDVVTTVDNAPVVDAAALNYAFGTHRPGDSLRLGVRRAGGEQALIVHAEAAPATPPRDEQVIAGRNPFQGATVVNLSPAVAEEVGIDPFGHGGVLVLKATEGAARLLFQPGDIIRAVNGREIKSVRDLTNAVVAPAPVWQFTVERNGQQLNATVRA